MIKQHQIQKWHQKEDSWAIIIALSLVVLATLAFFAGQAALIKLLAVKIASWQGSFQQLAGNLSKSLPGLAFLYSAFLVIFSIAALYIGLDRKNFVAGFTLLFLLSLLVTVLGSNKYIKGMQLETPLLALMIGMLLSNTITLPNWFHSALRTEFYIKTGIILMGATLPFTIILQAGALAILQATIVSVATFAAIYFAATRLFKLDPRFGATLAAGGSICGVSASIAIGGACRAEKEHVSVSISMVIIWAVAMIFILPAWAKYLGMHPGPAGAWIGTSELADAAGFAAAEAIGDERAVKAFTLMKVVGRDMFVGVWALLVAFLSVTVWERKSAAEAERVSLSEIWHRFPKFVLGFFAASILVTLILANLDVKASAQFTKDIIGPLKTIRGWAFTWAFLSIGFTTRFRDLASFGWKPLAAFAIGVAINIPLGYLLSNAVFIDFWMQLK